MSHLFKVGVGVERKSLSPAIHPFLVALMAVEMGIQEGMVVCRDDDDDDDDDAWIYFVFIHFILT